MYVVILHDLRDKKINDSTGKISLIGVSGSNTLYESTGMIMMSLHKIDNELHAVCTITTVIIPSTEKAKSSNNNACLEYRLIDYNDAQKVYAIAYAFDVNTAEFNPIFDIPNVYEENLTDGIKSSMPDNIAIPKQFRNNYNKDCKAFMKNIYADPQRSSKKEEIYGI